MRYIGCHGAITVSDSGPRRYFSIPDVAPAFCEPVFPSRFVVPGGLIFIFSLFLPPFPSLLNFESTIWKFLSSPSLELLYFFSLIHQYFLNLRCDFKELKILVKLDTTVRISKLSEFMCFKTR